MDIEKSLTEFIVNNFLHRKGGKEVTRDEPLLDSGLIDSAGIFELVGFIEKDFNIEVLDEEIVPDTFETITNIVAYVNKKQKDGVG